METETKGTEGREGIDRSGKRGNGEVEWKERQNGRRQKGTGNFTNQFSEFSPTILEHVIQQSQMH